MPIAENVVLGSDVTIAHPELVNLYGRQIGDGTASIGSGSVIMCDVTLGENGLVGAGSVVTRDVPDFAIVLGVLARIVGDVRTKEDKQ